VRILQYSRAGRVSGRTPSIAQLVPLAAAWPDARSGRRLRHHQDVAVGQHQDQRRRHVDEAVGHTDTPGLSGANPIYAEVYFRVTASLSEKLGYTVLPREVQSVTWEAVRLLFPAEQKRADAPAEI
jgi:hypothetical protein